MSESENKPSADDDQSRGNLDLIPAFFQELLDQPEDAEPIPERATVILLPPDSRGDTALYESNLRMARTLAAEGQNVVLWTIGSGTVTRLQEYETALATKSSAG
jgi:hypothetical protein